VNGFRRSHEQALEAHRIAQATGDPVVRYYDVALLVLVSRDPDAANEFIARELQDLVTPDVSNQRLRETLRVYP
jgi:DNA-binding PucR family transcriptional regulator